MIISFLPVVSVPKEEPGVARPPKPVSRVGLVPKLYTSDPVECLRNNLGRGRDVSRSELMGHLLVKTSHIIMERIKGMVSYSLL